jgi:hypothetical protein
MVKTTPHLAKDARRGKGKEDRDQADDGSGSEEGAERLGAWVFGAIGGERTQASLAVVFSVEVREGRVDKGKT